MYQQALEQPEKCFGVATWTFDFSERFPQCKKLSCKLLTITTQ